MSQRAIVDFTRCFAVMVSARLPLLQALQTAAVQCGDERLRQTLHEVGRDLQGGRSLSEGFAARPAVFDPLFVHLARIGEAAGVLDQVLLRLAAHLEHSAALRRKVRGALAYPAFVLVVALAATTFLLAAVVPTFAEMYADFGAALPAPTRLVLRLSDLLTAHLGRILVAAGAFVAGAYGWRQTPRGRLWWDGLMLRLPVVGRLVGRQAVARFCRLLGTLLASGVLLTDALDLLTRAAGNRVVEREVGEILTRVRGGSTLNRPLRNTRLFPEMVVQMIAVGEQTAELDRMLLHAAAYYEQSLDAAVEGLAALLEPVLIVLIGLLLGGLLTALYLPLFGLLDVVG